MTTNLRTLLALAAFAAFTPAASLSADAAHSVVCKDGSTAESGRGACRGHGGVDKAAQSQGGAAGASDEKARTSKAQEKAEKKAKKAEEKAAKQADKEKGEAAGAATVTVTCKDGSTSKGGRGACRGHGGEDKAASARSQGGAATAMPSAPTAPATPPAATAPAAPSARAPAKAPAAVEEKADPSKGPATARCKDGSFSYAKHHTGACSRHGGVAEWLDKN